MRHLVVVAHPHRFSFTVAVAHAYAEELGKLGHRVETRNLYALGFQPVLSSDELPKPGADHRPATDIRHEQDHITSADTIAFVYPIWWGSMPAILKGYIDRVLSYGFAYDFEGGEGMRPLLTSKQAMLFTLSAAPKLMLQESGEWRAMRILQDAHIFDTCGLDLIEHVHFGEIVPGLPAETAAQHLETARATARRHFTSNAA